MSIRLQMVQICLVGLFGLSVPVAQADDGQRASVSGDEIDFSTDIRPLLSDRCFVCHGPDAGQRATSLRLDDPESAYELAITPGSPESSELIARITSDDPYEQMPPPDSNRSLSESEKEMLEQWIASGADYEQHWAFIPPPARFVELETDPANPPVAATQSDDRSGNATPSDGWEANPIDRFVRLSLEREGLQPSPRADRTALLRRVTLDLTGLPPTPEQVDAFLSDESPNAYERVVDRLLESPRFGEHMAVPWLDAARYADTHGYQNDRYRPMWPWRDWVVEAFNENLPYDQFITWQLAGDLLPDPSREQILATAFNRNHRQTNEGGSVEEEFRAEYVADRVNTFGAAFLGLTLECCRCHDHKYDPISQREYYQLSGFFNSIDESGVYSHFTDATPTPALTLADESTERRRQELESEIASLESELADLFDSLDSERWRQRFQEARPDANRTSNAEAGDNDELASAATLRDELEQAIGRAIVADYSLDKVRDGKVFNRVTTEWSGTTTDAPEPVAGKVDQGFRMSGENAIVMDEGGGFTRNQPFSVSLWVSPAEEHDRAVIFHRSRAWTDAASRGYELLLEQGKLSAALVHFWPGNAIRVRSRERLPVGQWSHVTMAYDGSSRADGLQLFVDGHAVELDVVRDKLTRNIKGDEADQLTFGQRFRDVGLKQGRIDELKVFERRLTPLEIKYLWLRDACPEKLDEFFIDIPEGWLHQQYLVESAEYRQVQRQLRETRDALSALWDPTLEIMVMREMETPRDTYLLERGAYDARGDRVERGWPEVLTFGERTSATTDVDGQRPPTRPDNQHSSLDRLDLARWLTNPRHPLTSRVAVNRFWQQIFGQGLVGTSEDFGQQGESPSHPRLLDWLARNFIDSGWNVKRLVKTIVMSSTYRQQSDPSARLLEIDPENRLLARGPANRMSAEMVRDAALAASGLLDGQMGGAAVKPYQPEGLWKEKSGVAYTRDEGSGSHRRSLYTYWKRTSPPPNMMTFDASNREVCTVRRQSTMTPLQALVLLNDPQFVEAARALAARSMLRHADTSNRLAFIYRSLCGRSPSDAEQAILQRMFSKQWSRFEEAPQAAEQLLGIGDHRPASSDLPSSELAALAEVAQGLFTYDEFLMNR